MISIKKHIPNTITCMNLLCGCFACMAAFKGYAGGSYIYVAAMFICAAAVFDFLDGFAARLLHAYSPMGKELDSLADLISFGLAPGIISYQFASDIITTYNNIPASEYVPYLAFLIPIFSALRLAKFNIDERQTTSFIGLPVPANALFWIGVYFFGISYGLQYPYIWIALVIIFSYLLVSEIPMFSLKFKNYSLKSNYLRYIQIITTVILVLIFGLGGFAPAIMLYILLSLLQNYKILAK
ncbi:MAG: CDP-diacylglycerol--serine O-phosphatidyltransferase [Bacteroidales bacterium]